MNQTDAEQGCSCLLALGILLVNITLGGMSINYLLQVWFSKDIPWIGDILIGLFLAELSIPAAVITWVLRYFGAI